MVRWPLLLMMVTLTLGLPCAADDEKEVSGPQVGEKLPSFKVKGAYAAAGKDDLKQVAVTSYDSIIAKIKSVLAQMQQEERLAAVIAGLRELLKLWGANTDEVSKRRGEAGSEVFGPDRDDKDKSPTKPPTRPKDGK